MTLRRTIQWPLVAVGVVSFAGAHLLQAAGWRLFDPSLRYPAWFLNSGRAVAFTAAWLLITGAIVGAFSVSDDRDGSILSRGMSVALGAVVAMVVVLVATGPGTLFPIAILVGALIVVAATLAGVFAGARVRS